MSAVLAHLLSTPAIVVYLLVATLVFVEDALFVGFVLPGETAAILGGVDAARHHVALVLLLILVVAAEIAGDSVGYEIGRRLGPRVLRLRILNRHRQRLDDARSFLARRGGWAVFFGRAIAFFRAVMPALAGASRMPYRRFLVFNAAGGLLFGTAAVMVGFVAGDSYRHIEAVAGRTAAAAVAAVVVVVLLVWHIRRRKGAHSRTVRAAAKHGDHDASRERLRIGS